MTDKTEAQPEALRLADSIDPITRTKLDNLTLTCAATELRFQHAEIQQLKAQLSARQASPTVQVRPLDGSFTQSMAKVKRIPATPKSIAEHFGRKGTVELRPYAKHERNQWDTHLILIEGQPVGYANGPISLTPIEQEPLTDEQIEKLRKNTFSTDNPFCPCDRKTMQKAVRAAERAHGIGATNDNP